MMKKFVNVCLRSSYIVQNFLLIWQFLLFFSIKHIWVFVLNSKVDLFLRIEDKSMEEVKEEYITHYIHGLVGKHTWKEELRGYQIDHTQAADRGPLSPTLTGKLPPIAVSGQEALLLG